MLMTSNQVIDKYYQQNTSTIVGTRTSTSNNLVNLTNLSVS